jgi:hypothetical protein
VKLLPYEFVVYKSKLQTEEIEYRVKSLITGTECKYEGFIENQRFKIERILPHLYYNGYKPIIIGTVLNSDFGTNIHIEMRLRILVMIFTYIIYIGMVTGIFFFLIKSSASNDFELLYFIPLVMSFLAFLLINLAFKHESNKSKKDLKKLFEAEITEL